MTIQHTPALSSIRVVVPGQPDIRIGPLSPDDAHDQSGRLQLGGLTWAQTPGTTIITEPYNPTQPHLGPLPLHPGTLATIIVDLPNDEPWPSTRDRLEAQIGVHPANRLWAQAEQTLEAWARTSDHGQAVPA